MFLIIHKAASWRGGKDAVCSLRRWCSVMRESLRGGYTLVSSLSLFVWDALALRPLADTELIRADAAVTQATCEIGALCEEAHQTAATFTDGWGGKEGPV